MSDTPAPPAADADGHDPEPVPTEPASTPTGAAREPKHEITISETCACAASMSITAESLTDAQLHVIGWRADHRCTAGRNGAVGFRGAAPTADIR